MYSPLEVTTRSLIPALKRLAVERLLSLGFSETQVAKMVGLSQSAISRYVANERGILASTLSKSDLNSMLESAVKGMVEGRLKTHEFLHEVDKIALYALSKGYVCTVCVSHNPQIKLPCTICLSDTPAVVKRELV
ncbi:hypothetical protein B9Q11_04725 [Candidatus Marsarchaeota G2 archaeon ECH_B_SAG-F08]|uniref:HTH cro/C1-type domain-containing protein n=6 Tax=Candidatus Marsarchaeota TaxID=1978152 RepID=A0A2R6C1K3_9ARCH|nr:MAG: hypothetical protein B9Q01_02260 [Candidatus Marsarchaeota G1 archaeon OSP_D]PSN85770.1 MAG: hypothetical protein B9Q02_04935 [Candidatus Marsarchaeota G1 archaeon BE_D]PSN89047.1 MAG: hypothetical protein B9Q00_03050 [Candidatus Marsarchaeota G1 archaeon OSP_C]PSN97171.1 MAG: hypothetical protein B9Q11_04725 [Candidatus Marsarchaeota G2 archaeon ECH_B_SAG-F08]PSO03072.1 MAG: hypothetical protein B9Q10_00735 [Candidatus Marsarchaeota G2 archaeon ECH_B_SAG-E12]PSO04790.1 MAG: hypothetic